MSHLRWEANESRSRRGSEAASSARARRAIRGRYCGSAVWAARGRSLRLRGANTNWLLVQALRGTGTCRGSGHRAAGGPQRLRPSGSRSSQRSRHGHHLPATDAGRELPAFPAGSAGAPAARASRRALLPHQPLSHRGEAAATRPADPASLYQRKTAPSDTAQLLRRLKEFLI